MAYAPNDDRFYDALTGAGRDYQKYRDKVAEDQAATTRELGHIYGQALPGVVNAGMKGADWSMKRAGDQQKMDLATSEEARAAEKAGRDTTEFDWKGEDRAAAQRAAEKAAAYDASPATEEEAAMAGLKYHSGMTHEQLRQEAGIQGLGKDMRDFGQKQTEEGGRNTRQTEELTSAEKRAADNLAAENARAAASQAGENSRLDKKIAADKALEGMKLAQPKPPTDAQVKTAGFARTAKYNNDIINALEAGDPKTKRAPYDPATYGAAARSTMLGKPFAKESDRSYNAAKSEFISAVLRPESGAVLGPNEVATKGESLFPQAGDTPRNKAEKRARREELALQLEQAAGPAATSQVVGKTRASAPIVDTPAGGNGTAYAGDDNANLSPEDLQAAMVEKANAPKGPKPLHQMTIEEKRAEAKARGITP